MEAADASLAPSAPSGVMRPVSLGCPPPSGKSTARASKWKVRGQSARFAHTATGYKGRTSVEQLDFPLVWSLLCRWCRRLALLGLDRSSNDFGLL